MVAKDATGNLVLTSDSAMGSIQDTLTLMYSGALSAWVELSRSDNGHSGMEPTKSYTVS